MCIVNILDCTMEIEYFIYRTLRESETGYKYLVVYMSYRIIFGYLSLVISFLTLSLIVPLSAGWHQVWNIKQSFPNQIIYIPDEGTMF